MNVAFSSDSACCVVLASEGYPKKYESGFPITMSEEAAAHTYIAGAKKDGNALLTAGGRVLGVTAVAPTLEEAVTMAHELAKAGDIVSLSPASASFDCYPNFEVRGQCYKALVNGLK